MLQNSGLSRDLARGGVSCYWPQFAFAHREDGHIPCYPRLSDAVSVIQASRKGQEESSDSSVLGEVDYLFGDVSPGGRISETLQRSGASVYQVKSGEKIPLHGNALLDLGSHARY